MKKEIAAVGLLMAIFAGALINIHYINSMATELTGMAREAADCAESGDWDGAKSAAKSLAERWEKYDGYTHIIMHHDQIDATTDAIYGLLTAACDEETGTAARAELVENHIDSLASIERLRFGSIF